jgi:hypothetical protein
MGQLGCHLPFFLLFLVFAISSGVTESFRMGTEIHDTCRVLETCLNSKGIR